MSSSNSNQRGHRTLRKTDEKDFSSPHQITEAQSWPSQTMKNGSVVNTSAADTDECEDDEFPSQVRNSKQMVSEQEYTRSAANESPTLSLKGVGRYLLYAISNSPSTNMERHTRQPQKSSNIERSPEQLQAKSSTNRQILKGKTVHVEELSEKFDQEIKEKEAEWQAKERKLKDQLGRMQSQSHCLENEIQQIQSELEHRTRILEAKVQQANSEKEKVEADYNLFIRQKQEEKFKEMGPWIPIEGSKVIGDLDRLKRDMRSFGKGMSTNDLSVFQRLEKSSHEALMNDLAEVCVLRSDSLPEGLTSSKSPGLLLNALLAHHVYTVLFKDPFFFLNNGLGDVPKTGLDSLLNEIYSRTQQANQEEAHIWRSQTLRLLLPPLRNNTSSQEKGVHLWTSELISNAANLHATRFLEGPAQYLIRDEAKANCSSKLRSIYHTAANISYMMWTRRTTMKCFTLKHLGQRAFNPESKDLIPHSSVKYDQFEDQLEGRPISLIIHPLLQLFGTNDAKDYDRGSVWAPAEVWLDSRKLAQ
ncbi:hypothetical protein V502_11373 [Pseudogymnoascus sp. VKM F-4520 (FW-2644)]|nr:hypothetical protein V502_11373 [Pseudogymnoascus sp. VKM F-4520 (FW-2644)]